MVAIVDWSRLVDEYTAAMLAEGIADPLGEQLTVAAVIADLCSLAGAEVPEMVEYALDGWYVPPVEGPQPVA